MEEQKPVTNIVPSVGRVVWYWPALDGTDDLDWSDTRQPCRADICHVNHDYTLNLSVNDHFGTPRARRGITLHQGDAENCSLQRPFATWMPYQKGQAAKTESTERLKADLLDLREAALNAAQEALECDRERLKTELLAEQVRELRLHNDATEREINRRQQNDEEADAVHLQEVPGMPPHQVRMRQERGELRLRIYRLKVFMGSEAFVELEENERYLLEDQRDHMEKYLETLEARIVLFQEQQDA